MKKREGKRGRRKPRTHREWSRLFRLAEKDEEAARYVSRLLELQWEGAKPGETSVQPYMESLFRDQMGRARAEFTKAINPKSKETAKNSAPLLYFEANGRLDDLFQRANKADREAARYLLSVLTYNVERFRNFCGQNPKLAREIRFAGAPWPLLHTDLKVCKGYLTLPADHWLRKLGIVRKGRSYNEETKGTRVALTLYGHMEFYRKLLPLTVWSKDEAKMQESYNVIRRLKPLSPQNYEKWWKAAEPLFMKQWGKEFQDDSDFRRWNAKAYQGLKPHHTRSAKRRDIKKAIKQGFKSLANALRDRVLD